MASQWSEWSFATNTNSCLVEIGVEVANVQLGIQITSYEKDEKILSPNAR